MGHLYSTASRKLLHSSPMDKKRNRFSDFNTMQLAQKEKEFMPSYYKKIHTIVISQLQKTPELKLGNKQTVLDHKVKRSITWDE